VVRKNVEGAVLGGELGLGMVDLLREVGGDPGVEDDVRRDVEVKEFAFWRKLVGCLPRVINPPVLDSTDGSRPGDDKPPAGAKKGKSRADQADDPNALTTPTLFAPPAHAKVTRQEALSRTDGLARGFVLLNIGSPEAEEGWSWVLEGKDEPSLCESDKQD
jgi:superkiller protein 3